MHTPDLIASLPFLAAVVAVVVSAVVVRENLKALTAKVDSMRAEWHAGQASIVADLKDVRAAVAEGSTEVGRLEERIDGLRRDHDGLRGEWSVHAHRRSDDSNR